MFVVHPDPWYANIIKYLVWQNFGQEVSFHFVMTKHVGDILVVKRQWPKFFNVVFIGLLYLRMLLSIVKVALDANS